MSSYGYTGNSYGTTYGLDGYIRTVCGYGYVGALSVSNESEIVKYIIGLSSNTGTVRFSLYGMDSDSNPENTATLVSSEEFTVSSYDKFETLSTDRYKFTYSSNTNETLETGKYYYISVQGNNTGRILHSSVNPPKGYYYGNQTYGTSALATHPDISNGTSSLIFGIEYEEKSSGFSNGFNYRKKIPVEDRSEGALTDYQMPLIIYSGAGTDSAGTVYLNNHCLNWPNDIRFTQSDGSTELDYWYQISSSSWSGVRCWIKIPSISNISNVDYYIYYGSSNASDDSSGSDTWDYYNDYSTVDTWETYDAVPYYRALKSRWMFEKTSFRRVIKVKTWEDPRSISTSYNTDIAICNTISGSNNGTIMNKNKKGFQYRSEDNNTTRGFYFRNSSNISEIWEDWVHGDIYHIDYIYISANSSDFISGSIYSNSGQLIMNSGVSSDSPVLITDETHQFQGGSGFTYSQTYLPDSDSYLLDVHRIDGSYVDVSGMTYFSIYGKASYPEPTWGTVGDEDDGGDTTITISNPSGCVASGLTTATISAKVTNHSGQAWMYWGESDQGKSRTGWDDSEDMGYRESGSTTPEEEAYFTSGLTGLDHSTTYYYQAYISSNDGNYTDWLDTTVTFSTKAPDTITVTTNGGAGLITKNSARLSGAITAGSGTCWIVWGDNNPGTTNLSGWDYSSSKGTKYATDTFIHNIGSLQPSTIYYYGVYCSSNWADNHDDFEGTSFQTLEESSDITISDGPNVTASSCTTLNVNATAGSGGTAWFLWKKDSSGGASPWDWPYSSNQGTITEDVQFSDTIYSLDENSTYYIGVYVSSAVNGYSDVTIDSFDTRDPTPSITTDNVVVGSNNWSVTLNGDVTRSSGTVWFVWEDGTRTSFGSFSDWDYSTNKSTKYNGAELSDTITRYTSARSYTAGYYISSNWYNGYDDFAYENFTFEVTTKPVIDFGSSAIPNYGATWVNINYSVTENSGTAWVYYDESYGGAVPGTWSNSSQIGDVNIGTGVYKLDGLENSTSYYFELYISSQGTFGGDDYTTDSNNQQTRDYEYTKDLVIFYSTMATNWDTYFIEGWCSRWDEDNDTVVFETVVPTSDVYTLRDHLIPGAASELYSILGKKFYYDQTWEKRNTIYLYPTDKGDSQLKNTRDRYICYIRDMKDTPIAGTSKETTLKIEAYVSGAF